jgi:hypothetical protein
MNEPLETESKVDLVLYELKRRSLRIARDFFAERGIAEQEKRHAEWEQQNATAHSRAVASRGEAGCSALNGCAK